ncbi:MAG: type II secretion system protein, partial [Candidatus Paceibacterota bacterium]
MQSSSNKSSFTPLKKMLRIFSGTPSQQQVSTGQGKSAMPTGRQVSSFTLIELLIVIGILAILTAAVVIVLNPTELLKQGRDSTRMTDLASLSK